MGRRERLAVGGVVVAVSVLASVLAAPDLPEQLVTRWSASGEANATMAKPLALALAPAIAVGLLALFEVLPRIDPLGENIEALGRFYDLLVVVIVGLLGYVHLLVIAVNLGYDVGIAQAIAPALAVVYYVAGVIMERVDQNWFVGIRTPWTLSDEAVWERTHERGATLFKIVGILALGGAVFPEYLLYFAVGPVVLVAIYTTVFSYVDYRRRNSSG